MLAHEHVQTFLHQAQEEAPGVQAHHAGILLLHAQDHEVGHIAEVLLDLGGALRQHQVLVVRHLRGGGQPCAEVVRRGGVGCALVSEFMDVLWIFAQHRLSRNYATCTIRQTKKYSVL